MGRGIGVVASLLIVLTNTSIDEELPAKNLRINHI